ncbi:MAG: aminotransferase class V-fold PLP-dependent enzyme [Firmicutes bacterium]|nr:aminotransferase class V-fold PLP-dependent enzyme [Bacillota bacterium]MCL5992836.1 aminotransferase class V-fold PLP-dependent enzyme [Bacillota bacterium]
MLAGTNTFFCVDAAQTAGTEVVDFAKMRCDYLAFTGHKGLLGPPGIGGLASASWPATATNPLIEGGTGSRSEDEYQPDFLPDKFESGTQNLPGIAGLAAGVRMISEAGLTAIRKQRNMLMETLLLGLSEINGVTIYGTKNAAKSVPTVSIKMAGVDSGDLSFMLDQAYEIQTRSGLHYAPLAHKTIGTFPEGTVRFSLGYQNTAEDVDAIIAALREISAF